MKILTLNAFIRPYCINSYYNSVVSYWKGDIRLRDIMKGDYKDKRLDEILKHIKKENYDIVCLQEVFKDNITNRVDKVKIFAQNNNYFLYLPTNIIFCKSFTSSGLCIMSKYPIIDSNFIKYKTRMSFPNVLSDCGFMHVTVLKENKKVNIINLHLQSGCYKTQSKIRHKQIDEIYNYIETNLNEDENIIINGDFNADLKLWKYVNKKFIGFKDPFLDTMLNDVYTFKHFNTCEIQRFDGIMYRFSNLEFDVIKSRVDPIKCDKIGYFNQVSDHSAIISEFI